MTTTEVLSILQKHGGSRGGLISVLEEIQSRQSYLPVEALKTVAKETGRSLVDVYGLATFYKSFSLKPRGKYQCSVCMGTACHVRGAPLIAEEFSQQLGTDPGETTPDKEFTLEMVNCLGACALGPIVVVDGHYFSKVNKRNVDQIINDTREGLDKFEIEGDKRFFPVIVSCPRCNRSLMDPNYFLDGVASIRVTASFGRKHGWLRLSSFYGSYTIQSEYEIPMEKLVDLFCPHCHTTLNSPLDCPDCDAPMVTMIVRQGGVVRICSRRGCKGHMLDLA
jgi:NADH-quinone oxidoreductase subunit E